MEITIPAWAVWMIVTFGGGWVLWMVFLTKMAFQSKEDSRVSTANDITIMKEISNLDDKLDETKKELNAKMDDSKKDFHDSLNRLANRIDTLFGSELSFMKGLAASQQGNRPV